MKPEADLTVNMDRKCERCGKPGVAYTKGMNEQAGKYCLKCTAIIMGERMAHQKEAENKKPTKYEIMNGAPEKDPGTEQWMGRVVGVNFKNKKVGAGDGAVEVPTAFITLESGVYPGLADHLTGLLKETVYFTIQKVQPELPGLEEKAPGKPCTR